MKFSLNFGKKNHPANSSNKLAETSLKGAIELSDEDLSKVSGGADMFLKLDGVKGESQSDTHKNTIEVKSF